MLAVQSSEESSATKIALSFKGGAVQQPSMSKEK